MNKVKLVVVAAVLAAPMTAAAVDTAEAGPRLSRLFRVAHTLRVMRHTQPRVHVYRRSTTYRETTYREPSKYQEYKKHRETTTAPRKAAQHNPSPNAVGIRQTDARGRVYDPGSMVWFDGGNQCWTGTQPWSFKNNAWYYGSARWYPTNGSWQSDTADPPAPVGCQTVPTFAAVTPAPQDVVRYDASDAPAVASVETKSVRQSTPAPVADRPANCRKYFAVIGETVSVPCDPGVEAVAPAAKPEFAPAPVRVAEPAPPAHAPAAAPAAGERTKEVVRVKGKRRARDNDDD
jgi:hypothetical protein